MSDINTLYLFVFIFSILVILRSVIKLISSLFKEVPEKYSLYYGELIFLGLSISYITTYIIQH
jgi:hypothetical protein